MNNRDRIVVRAMHVRGYYADVDQAVFQGELSNVAHGAGTGLTERDRKEAAVVVEKMFGSFALGEWVKLLSPQELNAMVSGFDKLQVGDERTVMGTYLAEAVNREERRRVENDLPVTYEFSGREQS